MVLLCFDTLFLLLVVGMNSCLLFWAATVVNFSFLFAVLCSLTIILCCPVVYRLAVAILACFTARRWRPAVPTAASWRLAAVLEGPGGGPCFCSLFPIFIQLLFSLSNFRAAIVFGI